jgi:hypothetical protein
MPEQKQMLVQKSLELLVIHIDNPDISLQGYLQEMSYGFINTPLKRFPNNDDLQSIIHESEHTILKDSLQYQSGSY